MVILSVLFPGERQSYIALSFSHYQRLDYCIHSSEFRFILLSIQRKFIFSVFLIHHLIGILKLLVRFPITALHS